MFTSISDRPILQGTEALYRQPKSGVYLVLENFDQMFHTMAKTPIIINNFDATSEDERHRLNRLLYTQYEGDTLEVMPSCDCNALKGEYRLGNICKDCGTVVQPITERPLEPHLWIKAPLGVNALINPIAWTMLSDSLTSSGVNLFEWLCNRSYKPRSHTADLNKLANSLENYRFNDGTPYRRSLNYLYDHFDELMQLLFDLRLFKGRIVEKQLLMQWIAQNRGSIFCQFVPIPNRLVFITESTPTGTYADTTMDPAIDAIRTITNMESSPIAVSAVVRESRSVKAISQLAEFYKNFIKNSLGGKPGWFRQHIFGGRSPWTARAVISSISEPHSYRNIHIPWGVACNLLNIHVSKKLLDLGWSPTEINKHISEHVLKYDPLLDSIFQQLIAESPHGGIRCTLGRNPTLARLSIQYFVINKIKTDPTINTFGVPVLNLKGSNADFDGDELNLELVLDDEQAKYSERLAPHLGVFDLNQPRQISKNLQIPSPILSTIGNWLESV